MLNQIVLIGRLKKNPETVILDNGKKVCKATLAVRRSFKNQEGKYDTDFIKVSILEELAQNFQTYAEKGSLIAIKGRVKPTEIKKENGETDYYNEIIVEKINYL